MNFAKTALITFFSILVFTSFAVEPKSGYWQGLLKLNEETNLPFVFSMNEKNEITIYNAEEEIQLKSPKRENDSIIYSFIAFNTYLKLSIDSKKSINGFYISPDRKRHSIIPFKADYIGTDKPICNKEVVTNISGKWKTTFSPNSDDAYPAIGKFDQSESGKVTGTFLTETGDYRFLEGYLVGSKLILSCFDGSHAFLFTAQYKDNNLVGTFYSGSHWKTDWIAERNEKFNLKDPDSLTYMVKDDLTFVHPDTNKVDIAYPNKSTQGKVVIIQLIGTWCPNCLDETNFYKDLYETYHNDGLEIMGIAYEAPENLSDQIDRVKRYSANKNIPYPILIGGHASKKEASMDFNMLNEITLRY